MRSCCGRPNFQSGLVKCIRGWSGLQVWACSPQQFTDDTGACRLLHSQLAGATMTRFPVSAAEGLKAGVPRFASKVRPLCASAPVGQLQLRTQQQQFSWAVNLAAGFSLIGYVTLFLRPLGWVYGHMACRPHSICVLFAVPSFLFFSGLLGLCNPVPAVFPGYSSSTLAD